MKIKKEPTESVKVNKKLLNKVRRRISRTNQYGIGGYYDMAVKKQLEFDSAQEQVGNIITQPKD